MKNISEKMKKLKKTYFMLNNFFKNRAVYEIMWKNIAEPGRPLMTTWLVRIACWLSKAINTHTQNI
jgi:hypothetical protein